MADSVRLESVYSRKVIVGSNPTPSATRCNSFIQSISNSCAIVELDA